MDRQQFNRGDSQLLKIGNFLDHTPIGSGLVYPRAGMAGQAAHVGFVDNGFVPGTVQEVVALPIEAVVAVDHALGHAGQVARGRKGQVGPGRSAVIAVGLAEIPLKSRTAR
jgi:hypothetical protein